MVDEQQIDCDYYQTFDKNLTSSKLSFTNCLVLLYDSDSTFAYKLASITCLNIALKVYNRKNVMPSTLAELSRGEITAIDILAMECMILESLSYNLCPPTCTSFIWAFHSFLPPSVKGTKLGEEVVEKAIFLSELSVMELSFKDILPSHIAFAALLNVMDCILYEDLLSESERAAFATKVEECLKLKNFRCHPFAGKWMLNRTREMLVLVSQRSSYFEQARDDCELQTNTLIHKNAKSSMVSSFDPSENRGELDDERRDETDTTRVDCVWWCLLPRKLCDLTLGCMTSSVDHCLGSTRIVALMSTHLTLIR